MQSNGRTADSSCADPARTGGGVGRTLGACQGNNCATRPCGAGLLPATAPSFTINFIYIFQTAHALASKAITVGVGIPMIVVGALMAWLWAPAGNEFQSQVELVGSTIGILGVVFFVSGLFYSREPVMH